ncbi:hypothetical protein V5E97_06120 [Singulisphaera sp. Ch08]|uniref:Uncharacterized protein n=1 Tax=Singulisphaera sp. Ch08 TaxID=3120278 RepID=A0AAU7CJZ6_9BACT
MTSFMEKMAGTPAFHGVTSLPDAGSCYAFAHQSMWVHLYAM